MRTSAFIAVALGVVVAGAAVYVQFAPQKKARKPAAVVKAPTTRNSPEQLFARGGKDAVNAAVEEYIATLNASPDDVETLVKLGKAYLLLSKQADAEVALRLAARRIDPRSEAGEQQILAVKAALASALIARTEHIESKKLLDEVLAKNPRHGEANWVMGKLLAQKQILFAAGLIPLNAGELRGLIESLQMSKFERVAYEHVVVGGLTLSDAAAKMDLDTKFKADNKIESTIDAKLVESALVRLRSRVDEGLKRLGGQHFDLASTILVDNPDVLCDWGIVLLEQGRELDAETRFRQAIRLEEQGAKYYFWLGRALRKQSRFGPAIKAETQAHELSPKLAEAWIELGSIYAQIHEEREAESAYRAALSVEPSNVGAIEGLSRLLMAASDPAQRNYLEAAMLLKSGVDLTKGRDLNLMVQEATAFALGKYYEQAVGATDAAIALAKELKITPDSMELLLANRQEYQYQQNEIDRQSEGAPQTTALINEPAGLQGANPFDSAPLPRTTIQARVIPPANGRQGNP